jgi:hypothetical protein
MSVAHENTTARERRNLIAAGAGVVAIAFMIGAGALRHSFGEVVSDGLVFAGAIAAMIAATIYFLGLDEASRQAHYVSWLWGGSFGAVVAAFVGAGLLLTLPRNDRIPTLVSSLFGEANVQNGFFTGIGVIAAPMLIGYALWWTAFWLRRR